MEVLVGLGAVLAAGLLAARLSTFVRLPAVTGYLLVGIAIGPAVAGFIDPVVLAQFSPFNQFVLTFMALGIGRDLDLSYLRHLGPSLMYFASLQALIPFVLVLGALLLWGTVLPLALTLAAIATTTAPALTIAVMREMKSEGPLTRTHLVVVGMDDIAAILIFAFVLPLAGVLTQGQWEWQWLAGVTSAACHVGGSLLLAALAGGVFVVVANRLASGGELVIALVGLLALLSGLSGQWGLSPLLVALVAGLIIGTRCRFARVLDRQLDVLAPLLLISFFVVAGASLEPGSLLKVGGIGFLYIILRALGKVSAVYLGGGWVPMSTVTRRYLGLTLMPQASVAVGMMIMAQRSLPQFSEVIGTVILGAVFIYELIGPPLTRFAVMKAGEQGEGGEEIRKE